MSENIVLNSNNILSNSLGNNILEYNFPSSVKFNEGDTIALSGLHMYYSWFNITSKNNNNRFQYKWFNNTDGDVTDVFEVIIADGYYSVNTLSEYIYKIMVDRGHYLQTTDGKQNMYFIEILANSTYYSIEIRLSSVSQSTMLGNTLLVDAVKTPTTWVIPTQLRAPEVIIVSNNNFSDLVGFSPQTIFFLPTTALTSYSKLNDMNPNMEPSSSYYVTCNLVSNSFGTPNNILFSFALPQVSFGGQISPQTEIIHSKIRPGNYSQIRLEVYDQRFERLQIKDPNMLITLSIMKKDLE